MRIKIICVGVKPPAWVKSACDDYLARFSGECQVQLHELKAAQRTNGANAARWMELEAVAIEAVLPTKGYWIILDERGKDLSTKDLAQEMERWRNNAQDIAIVIGGPDGIAERLKKIAHQQIRLSSLTLPHAMVRVILLEQLFRAWSILTNHPYHRE